MKSIFPQIFIPLVLIALGINTSLYSQTYTSVTDGYWDDPSTWNLYQVPPITNNGKNSTVTVIINHHVIHQGDLNTGTFSNIIINSSASLNVEGSLILKNNNNITVNGNFIITEDYDCSGGQTNVNGSGSMTIIGDVNCSVVLPIELKTFYVENSNNTNNIQWTTSTEKNNSHFIVEYSNDGFSWEEIVEIKGSGNSTTEISYSTNHKSYDNGQNYYKLTQYDFDGKKEEFNIITINNEKVEISLIGIFNQVGQKVNEGYKGVKIYKYSDGSFDRVLQLN